MPRINAHGHRPAFPNITQALDPSTRPSAVPIHHLTGASSSATAFEVGVKTINQGFNSLKIHRPNCAESALRAQAKEQTQKKIKEKSTPYTSTSGASEVELNGLVKLGPSETPEAVFCRHFSTAFTEHTGKKSGLMDAFSMKAGIEKNFGGTLSQAEQAHEEAIRTTSSGCKHLVNSEQLGSYVKAMALQLEAPGRRDSLSEANCLLNTSKHSMALHVEKKSKNGVEYFSAKVYDPNVTASYRRVVKATPEDFAGLTLKDMMIKPQYANFYSLGGSERIPMVAVSLDERLQPQMSRTDTEQSAENMQLAMYNGLPEEVHAMLDTAFKEGHAPDQRLALLKAIDSLGIPGLNAALENGQSNVVDMFTQRVLESGDLTPQTKLDLLSAKRSDGFSGLAMAFHKGRSDAIDVFAKRVLESGNLTLEDKIELLSAKNSDGTPGLVIAFDCGQSEAIDVFTKRVLESENLTPEDKIDLLSNNPRDGTPGLNLALQHGNSHVVDMFSKRVLASEKLTSEDKIDLLSAYTSFGWTGLAMAFHKGNSDAIDVFTKRILETTNLTEEGKMHLLSAQNIDGTPGLSVAFYEGKSDAVDVFAKRIMESDQLTLENKVELLSSKQPNGVPGLAVAHQQKQLHTIDVFAKRISASEDLTQQAKSHLLNLNLPGLQG